MIEALLWAALIVAVVLLALKTIDLYMEGTN